MTGRAIALVTTKGPARGKLKVLIDGVYVGTVDLYRSSVSYRVLAFTHGFSSKGTHTIKLVALGTTGTARASTSTPSPWSAETRESARVRPGTGRTDRNAPAASWPLVRRAR